jgi:hypothetical protein
LFFKFRELFRLSRQAKLGRGGSQDELTKPLERNPVGGSPTWPKP